MKKILKFYSPTCGPCKVVSKSLEEVSRVTGVEVQEVDVTDDSSVELVNKYKVRMVPTVIVINEDSTHIFKGVNSTQSMLEALEDYFE